MMTKQLLGRPAALVPGSRLPRDRMKQERWHARSVARKAARRKLLRMVFAQDAADAAAAAQALTVLRELDACQAEHVRRTAENAAFRLRLDALTRSRVAACAAAAAAEERACEERAELRAAAEVRRARREAAAREEEASRRAAGCRKLKSRASREERLRHRRSRIRQFAGNDIFVVLDLRHYAN